MMGGSDPKPDRPSSQPSQALTPQHSNTDATWLSETLGQPIEQSLATYEAHRRFTELFPISFCREHGILGLQETDPTATEETVVVAIADRRGWQKIDTVARLLACQARIVPTTSQALSTKINSAYATGRVEVADAVLASVDPNELIAGVVKAKREDLLDSENQAPIIRLVNRLLHDAVNAGASDVHIQPAEEHVVVRQRVDGVLFESIRLPKSIQEEVLTRIKVMAKMNIAEKRLPQDGRATVELGDRVVDLRIASLPTSFNERIVIRLLDKSARLYTLGELGMDSATLARWRRLIRLTHGLILVTGPTGSGKSTTLYSALQEINSTQLNVLTIEDPIEYQLEGISQSQINTKKGLTFASGMRSVLRQDPDIIMVGEIRDAETAAMAMQASMTGHLVFSTLHTSDAAGAVSRLLDLQVEPYLISTSLVAVLAQRLVRRLCQHCRIPWDARPDQSTEPPVAATGDLSDSFIAGSCNRCRQTGYRGRVGVYELLVMDEACRSLVQRGASTAQLRDAALQGGMSLLFDDGKAKVLQGETTMSEVLRITASDYECLSE